MYIGTLKKSKSCVTRERLKFLENLFGSSLFFYTMNFYQVVSQHFLEHVKREENGQPYEISRAMIGAYGSGSVQDTSA